MSEGIVYILAHPPRTVASTQGKSSSMPARIAWLMRSARWCWKTCRTPLNRNPRKSQPPSKPRKRTERRANLDFEMVDIPLDTELVFVERE